LAETGIGDATRLHGLDTVGDDADFADPGKPLAKLCRTVHQHHRVGQAVEIIAACLVRVGVDAPMGEGAPEPLDLQPVLFDLTLFERRPERDILTLVMRKDGRRLCLEASVARVRSNDSFSDALKSSNVSSRSNRK
jgi:hypothetical protein